MKSPLVFQSELDASRPGGKVVPLPRRAKKEKAFSQSVSNF